MQLYELEKFAADVGMYQEIVNQFRSMLSRTFKIPGKRGSQGEEDSILRDLLPGDVGVYVDIGAGEPINLSNTWAFYERGWRGLLVEPLYQYWPLIIHHRPGDLLYDSAVRNYDGFTMLRVQGTVSSVLPNWNIQEHAKMMITCETTATMLAKFPAIRDACQLCSIDVEGAEKEVLETIDWATFHPEVFCVEYRDYNPHALGEDLSGDWAGILTTQGYKEVTRTPMNIIYQKADSPAPAPAPAPAPPAEPGA